MTALLNFDNVTAEIACNFRSDHQGLEAIGTRGTLFVPDPWHALAGVVVLNGEAQRVQPVSSYLLELENLCVAIRGDGAPLLGRDDALGQARAIDAVFRSGDTRRPIELR